MALTLRQLSYFIALAEERNFGRAAERVHVSQPALSMQIRDLEQSLGSPLFERLPRDVRLTSLGREVLDRARRVLADVQELERSARRDGPVRRLSIGVIPTVAPYLLPGALVRLRSNDIAQELRIREAQTDHLLQGLESGALDAVVIASPASAVGLIAEPLFADRFLLSGSAGHLARLGLRKDGLRPVELDPDQLLLLDEGHCLADQALDVCGLTRKQTRIDLGASSLTTLCGLVAQGLGLTLLPEIAVRSEAAAAPDMALVRFAAPEPERVIVLARRASSSGEGWFGGLAQALQLSGQELIDAARLRLPFR